MCCTRGHTALTAEHVVLKLGMHWYGWVVMRKVANLLCPDFWTLSGKVLKKKGKALLSLEPANHTEPGKLLYGQEDTAGSDRHKVRILMHRRPLRKQRTGQQTSHRCEKDDRIFWGFKWGFGNICSDWEKNENCPAGKQNWERPLCKDRISFDFKPLTLVNLQAGVSFYHTQADLPRLVFYIFM